MSECRAAMVTYTHASRAKRILQRYGYLCDIQRSRSVGDAGCGFVLVIRGDCGRVFDILRREDIPFRAVQEGRDAP